MVTERSSSYRSLRAHLSMQINHANDYSFALKADPDYANVYDAWWALIDINNQMFMETGRVRCCLRCLPVTRGAIQNQHTTPSQNKHTHTHTHTHTHKTVSHEPLRRHPLALGLGVPPLRRLRPPRRALRPHRGLLRAWHRCVRPSVRACVHAFPFAPACFDANPVYYTRRGLNDSGVGGVLPARDGEVRHPPQQGRRLPAQAALGQGQQGPYVAG